MPTICQGLDEMTWSHHLFLASQQHTMLRTQSYPSIGYHHPGPILQKRQPRLSRIKKYAKSCPWKIIMPGFEHLPSDKGSLQIFRLTHTRDTWLKGASYSEAWHDISCNSHTHTRKHTHTSLANHKCRCLFNAKANADSCNRREPKSTAILAGCR